MKITLTRNEIQAALLFARRDETRFIINGLNIEIKPHKDPLLVATDGRRIAVIKSVSATDYDPAKADTVTLGPVFLKTACSLSLKYSRKISQITIETAGNSATARGVGFTFTDEKGVINGSFPQWKQVVPGKRTSAAATEICFNPGYMADYYTAAKLLGLVTSKFTGLRVQTPVDGGPFEVKLGTFGEFYSLLMPMRFDSPMDNYKDIFLKDYLDAPAPAAEPVKAEVKP